MYGMSVKAQKLIAYRSDLKCVKPKHPNILLNFGLADAFRVRCGYQVPGDLSLIPAQPGLCLAVSQDTAAWSEPAKGWTGLVGKGLKRGCFFQDFAFPWGTDLDSKVRVIHSRFSIFLIKID